LQTNAVQMSKVMKSDVEKSSSVLGAEKSDRLNLLFHGQRLFSSKTQAVSG
jgi:hypothetical protein